MRYVSMIANTTLYSPDRCVTAAGDGQVCGCRDATCGGLRKGRSLATDEGIVCQPCDEVTEVVAWLSSGVFTVLISLLHYLRLLFTQRVTFQRLCGKGKQL